MNQIIKNNNDLVYWYLIIGLILVVFIIKFLNGSFERFIPIGNCNGKIHLIRIYDSNPIFDQVSLTIKKGDTVRWINIGDKFHTVTSDYFSSDTLRPGDMFDVFFNKLGTVNYYDSYNKCYNGAINVV